MKGKILDDRVFPTVDIRRNATFETPAVHKRDLGTKISWLSPFFVTVGLVEVALETYEAARIVLGWSRIVWFPRRWHAGSAP